MSAPATDDVAARYVRAPGRHARLTRVALVTVGALVAAALFTWTAIAFTSRDVRWQDISSRPLGAEAMELTFEVYAGRGETVRCVLRATDRDSADVGQIERDIGPIDDGTARETVRIRTLRPGAQASVRTCVIVPDQLP